MALLECPSCRHGNAENAKFCANCGEAIRRNCPHCKAQVEPGDRFCSACGGLIAAADHPAEKAAERRLTAVMFCDLVGSTALSESLDPEDLRAVVRAYHDACAKAVTRYDGHVAKYLGDGIVAFFGYPIAHEDDSKRAILAGLAILEAIEEINPDLKRRFSKEMSVRIGIHSGLVVAGEMGSLDRPVMDIVGDTPNIAARLQEVATPGSIVVSEETHRLTAQAFRFEPLGAKALKGISRPLKVYGVLAQRAEHLAHARRIVGRKEEVAQLERLWKAASQGNGRLALIRGDPGIGKSALINTMIERVEKDPEGMAIILHGSPYHQNTPFHPVIEYLRTTQLKVSRSDPLETQLDRLEDYVRGLSLDLADLVPVLAPLLSIPFAHRYPTPLLSPEGMRIKTIETILSLAVARASRNSVALVLDNAHWADPSTLELFRRIMERLPGLRMLVLVTFRPHYQPDFPKPAGTRELSLDRLDHQEVWSLAKRIAGGKELPFEILDHIASKTDGVPLFVEELTKTIIESGAVRLHGKGYELVGALKDLAIPTTLQGSLVARLERAVGRKDIAQVAAVVGREFTVEVVAAVAKVDEDTANRQLSNLVSADLVYPVVAFTGAKSYRFRHALIQDAAYDSLLKSVRQQYHSDIARTMETQLSDTAEEQPEVIATHYTSAGAFDLAIQWWLRAGQKALGRSANLEAIAHFTRGLELLAQTEDSPTKIQLELAMLVQRGTAYIATKGFAAPEVGKTFQRAEAICQLVGETPLLFPVIWGLWVYHLVRSDLEVSCGHAEHMLRLADTSGESGMYIEGHFTLGDSLFWLGRLEESRSHLDKALTFYDPEAHRSHTLLYGQDPGVTTLCYLAYTYWNLGFPDRALAFVDQANVVAEATRHPFSKGWALAFACSIRNWRKDYAQAREWAERCRDYCSEQGQAFWASASVASLGWATFYLGDREKGLALLRQGLAGYEMTGSIVVSPLWRAILAEVLSEVGELEEALQVVEKGLDTVAAYHEWVTEPYLRRVKGDILAKQGRIEEAEAEYRKSFDQAGVQHSLMRELQTATAWAKLKPSDEQMERLSRVLSAVTEGFDTRDVEDARCLLHAWPGRVGAG